MASQSYLASLTERRKEQRRAEGRDENDDNGENGDEGEGEEDLDCEEHSGLPLLHPLVLLKNQETIAGASTLRDSTTTDKSIGKIPWSDMASTHNPSPTLAALHQKSVKKITISDDRSLDSEFESTSQHLRALKPREAKSFNPLPVQDDSEDDNYAPRERNPYALPPIRGQNHPLQDYQLQLMLLEQQRKRRELMAGKKEDLRSVSAAVLNLPTEPIPNHPMSPDRPNYESGLDAQNNNISTKPYTAKRRKLVGDGGEFQDSRDQPRKRPLPPLRREMQNDGTYRLQNPTTLDCPGSSSPELQSIRSMNGSIGQKDLFGVDAKSIGIPEASSTNLETIQAYILGLQEKARMLEDLEQRRNPTKFQIFYRIIRETTTFSYFDRPLWVVGEKGSRTLRSSLPLLSVSSYLDKHPELAFIIYRDYDISMIERSGCASCDTDILPQVEHTSESLRPTTEDLTAAVAKFLRMHENYSDVSDAFTSSKLLSAPYLVIYHSRSVMEAFLKDLSDRQKQQFQLLFSYVLSEYEEDYRAVDSLLSRGKITYPYIKYLYKPGDILVEGNGQNIRAILSQSWLSSSAITGDIKSSKDSSKKEHWTVKCWSWLFNGVFSRYYHEVLLEFEVNDPSEKDINGLSLRPLAFVSKELAEMLRQRGEIFWKCRTRHFVSYHEDIGRKDHHSGDDRYMVDLKMYRELHKSDQNKLKDKEVLYDVLNAEATESDDPPDDKFVYLLPLTIKGYNLKTKKWLDLQVDRIAEVVWNKEAFESLVLEKETKNLIEALVSNQIEVEKSTDLIRGKGNGLILLLHGGPGTGKTLTAESVAEIAEKPLYPVTCGDIGTEPEEVERYLESVLALGKTWECVVLLDEADVFLEQRSLEDLRRNALVSVFLRVLEYYDGILILTSNRVGIFDEAFKSRIQLALHYANLGQYQRKQIWRNFIQRLKGLEEEKIEFDDLYDHVEELADNKMNGRQIRNAITIARQYAKHLRKPLNYHLLKGIIETAGRFDLYIEKLNGGYSQDQLAEDEGLRLSKAP